jgi:CRISPR system Cascade subunit CasD
MTEYLLFRLYGPLASWGDIAVGEYRPSYSYPSKSAICGMIAAALGIDRSEDEKHTALVQNLQFALSVLQPGMLLRDYHTIQTPGNVSRHLATRKDELADHLNTQTILSSRDYRVDAVYEVCLSLNEKSDYGLAEIKSALAAPKFTLYLGRKSCVIAFPLGAQILQADSALRAFENYKAKVEELWQGQESNMKGLLPGEKNSQPVSYFWEEASSEEYTHLQTRRDAVLSRRRRQFAERQEKYKMLGNAQD